MTASPLISIITPVKNGAAFLQRALDSAAEQSGSFEHVIVDGMSSDGTQDIIERNRKRISKVIRASDESATEALNRGVLESSGEIICLLMADDWLPKNALAEIGNGFAQNTHAELLMGAVKIVDETDRPSELERTLSVADAPFDVRRLLGTPYAAAFSFRRNLWERLGGFRTIYRYGADRDFLMRCLCARTPAAAIEEITYIYSINQHSDTLVDKPTVVEAFLQDHLVMASDWLSHDELEPAMRSDIESWRRIQANELFGRRVRRRKLGFAIKSLLREMWDDPAQISSTLAWCNQRVLEKVRKSAN